MKSIDGPGEEEQKEKRGNYDDIGDVGKLERLVRAKEKTKVSLEGRVGWVGMEQARAEEIVAGAGEAG